MPEGEVINLGEVGDEAVEVGDAATVEAEDRAEEVGATSVWLGD